LIRTLWFNSKIKINADTFLASGILQAMNSLFGEIFNSKKSIQYITGANANLLIESGQLIVGMLLTEKISTYLAQSLKLFVKDFETQFQTQLQRNRTDEIQTIAIINSLAPIFPNIIIDSIKSVF
jgi:hypothetical protein